MDTSDANIRHLCRGSDTIWDMHKLPLNIAGDHIGLVIGTARGFYRGLPALMWACDRGLYPYTKYAYDKDRYCKGLNRSDGIVPVTSQNLKSCVPDIPDANVVEMPKTHTGVQTIKREGLYSSRTLFNLIKAQMNAQ